MDMTTALDWSREALRTALILGGPALLTALAVGLFIGALQTMTQLHEPTISLIPRLVAVALAVLALLPWMIGRWVAFAVELIENIPERF